MSAVTQPPVDDGRWAVVLAWLAVLLACALLAGCNHVETSVGSLTVELHLAAEITAEIAGPTGEPIATITTTRKESPCAPSSPPCSP